MADKARLCVICPCYNEEEVIGPFYDALRATLDGMKDVDAQMLFVDDGSKDGTLDRLNDIAARDSRVLVYSLSRNFGHQVAISAGLAQADADAVVMMDSDLQHPPALIPRMVQLWREGADVVSAVRVSTDKVSPLKKLASAGFYRCLNWLSTTPVIPNVADFCLLDRGPYVAMRGMPERHRFLRGMVSWVGFRRVFLDYEAPARAAGRSKYTWRKMLRLASDALLSFSSEPLRFSARLGLATVAGGAAYMAYILGRLLLLGDLVPGWSSIVCVMLLLGGVQLCFLGLIGEYLARVYEEVKGRPLYLFKQTPAARQARSQTPARERRAA